MNRRRLLVILALAVTPVASFSPRSADAACAPGDLDCGWMNDYNKHVSMWFDSHHHAGSDPSSGYHFQQGPWASDTHHGWVEGNYTMEVHGCCEGVPPGSCGAMPEGGLLEEFDPVDLPNMPTPFLL